MKNSIYKQNFEKNFVKPLYRVKTVKIKPKVLTNTDKTNLVGDVFSVNVNSNESYSNIRFKDVKTYKILPGECEEAKHYNVQCGISDSLKNVFQKRVDKDTVMEDTNILSNSGSRNEEVLRNNEQNIEIKNRKPQDLIAHPPESWLRVYPAPVVPGEGISSIILRCLTCQLGLTACLVLWTLLWVFVLHSFEAPHEIAITENFIKEQNQLVIDLATELRQITPISPKWREAIIQRIEEGRIQTLIAAGKGVKLDPGWYWDLAGTFLFTVYVMTALGFGAPVPQTVYGRCMSLLYAVFAIPTHVYLMINASTCTIAHIDHCLKQWEKHLEQPPVHNKDSPSSHMNSDVKSTRRWRRLWRLASLATVGHGVPLAGALYYCAGALVFGGRAAADVALFPLRFTTGGGLATVEFHYRILYGFYVEGAVAILHCGLATVRRHSGNAVSDMTLRYRLFTVDKHGR